MKSAASEGAGETVFPQAGCRGDGPVHLRVLVLAPTGNDAALTFRFLGQNGMTAEVCRDMPDLCARIREGCGAIIVAEEALGPKSIDRLSGTLSRQESWSDIPLTVITRAGRDISHTRYERLRTLDSCGSVTILERPFRPDTLLKNAEVSLRARRRQYQVRDLLEESRRREEVLRASEERFRRMSDSAPVLVWMAGLDKRRVWFNKAWLDFTGRSMDDEVGNDWTEGVHPEDRERCLGTYSGSFDVREEFQMEYRLRRRDGSWGWLLDRGVPVYGADEELAGYIGSCVDITERKETLVELEKLVSERTASLRQTIGDLESFSYTVSHDLRAPLRALQSYAQILAEEYGATLDDDGRNYLERIVKAGRRLDGLIQDVLAYSRVSRRDYPMRPVDLDPLVSDIVRQYPDLHGATVLVEVRPPLGVVTGSEALLTQCLSNLLGNAAKFVAPGRHAHIVLRGEDRDGKRRLWVEDNGIGIPAESRERIFGMFERLDLKLPRRNGLEVLEWIRGQPGLSGLVVVVLTSSNHSKDIDSAARLNANSFLVKPSNVEDLTELIRLVTKYWFECDQLTTRCPCE